MIAALVAFGLFLAAPVDFQKDIAPILETRCTSCHHDGSAAGHLDLTTRDFALNHSQVLLSSIESGVMPPGGKLSSAEIESIGRWIKAGAYWPQNYVLKVPAKPIEATPASLELDNVRKIGERIAAQALHKTASPYSVTLPNTTVSFEMVPIPAGKFVMGSSDSDPMHKPDEQPSHQVTVEPFWMQAHEVTWDEYRLFMFAAQAGEIARKDDTVDAVSRPTRPYVEMSFGMGINGFPAISMTQHAANKYAEWLSAKTGEFYRLPTEAEWEYACRAGTTTAFYFGSDASQLKDYAWYSANSGGKYQKVATKKPNPWGLYDMLGNVMEWTLDAYAPYRDGSENEPWVVETQPYPTSVRGGSWNDPADQLRCASRVASDPSWKQQDPQLPKSIWYETDAQWLGFRLIRPVKLPTVEAMFKYWNSGVEHDEQ